MSAKAFLCAAAALSASQAVSAIDPAHAKNITIYHINPQAMGPVPLNMDTGDAAGDAFFDMFEVITYPLVCPEGPDTPVAPHHHNSCANPEAHGETLVVNKLTLEVDARFSGYAKCNIGVNGTDGHGNPCKDGTYCCYCEEGWDRQVPCNATLGFENVTSYFGSMLDPRSREEACMSSRYECFEIQTVEKLGGEYYGAWYSSLKQGCEDPLNPTDDCTWRVVSTDAIINRTCHNRKFFEAISKYNETCFGACGTNTSDACHANCFFETVLGPGAGMPFGHVGPETGIPIDQVVEAWETGFKPEAAGGCPRLPIPSGKDRRTSAKTTNLN